MAKTRYAVRGDERANDANVRTCMVRLRLWIVQLEESVVSEKHGLLFDKDIDHLESNSGDFSESLLRSNVSSHLQNAGITIPYIENRLYSNTRTSSLGILLSTIGSRGEGFPVSCRTLRH